jgi:hypothetical protein
MLETCTRHKEENEKGIFLGICMICTSADESNKTRLPVLRTGALANLQGGQCLCGERKTRGQTFCKGCYYQLQRGLQRALYADIFNGYLDAVRTAVLVLIGKGRFTLATAQERLGS